MKNIIAIIIALAILAGCQSPAAVIDTPDETGTSNDPRLDMVDSAADAHWIRKPAASRGIADGDPAAALCDEPGWSYIFYDDAAVIGYEPFPENIEVMHRAVAITVELHNRDNPDAQWDYINVSVPIIPPDTSHDPVLAKWQFCLCLDDGTIVEGPYTAEFDFNWAAFKASGAAFQLEMYNRDHDPDAHIVWGTE